MSAHTDFRAIAELHRNGRLEQAEPALRAWLAGHPEHAEGHYRLGILLHQTGRAEESLTALMEAARLDPGQAAYPYQAGSVLHDLGRLEEAEARFRHALALRADLVQAHNNLGLVLRDRGRPAEAIASFEAALRLKSDYAAAANNLGTVLDGASRVAEALAAFRRAVQARPDYPEAWDNLGRLLLREGELQEAVKAFREVLRLHPGHLETLRRMARCLEPLGRMDDAIEALRQATRARPEMLSARADLARLLAMINHCDEAVAEYRAILAQRPDHLGAAIGAALTLPVVYASAGEIDRTRERFRQGLEELRAGAERFMSLAPDELLRHLNWGNFLLAYQGRNDRPLQAAYGAFAARLLRHALPELMAPITPEPTRGRRIRVGFASAFFTHCTVGMYFRHWITRLDRQRFETVVYQFNPRHDQVGREIEAHCDRYLRLAGNDAGDVRAIAERIRGDRLDVLIYPELGMNTRTFLLAALRLAPVQCAGWGHPVTTGHGNVDHFLSCAALEPPDAQDHYSERLVLLDGIGTYYARPPTPSAKRRADLGLPEERTLYLFPQSLFKIHPDNDPLLARVLAADPQGMLVMFEGRHPDITDVFLARLRAACEARGVSLGERLVLLPYLPHDDYLRVNRLCDIMLDCLHWSGGNTSFDALSSGLPVVTLAGAFMRGRQSAGMLGEIGVGELIAADADEYVRIATRLGLDPAWRAGLRARLLAGVDRLFERNEPIDSLQRFLQRCVTPE